MKTYKVKDEMYKHDIDIVIGTDDDLHKYLYKHYDATTREVEGNCDARYLQVTSDEGRLGSVLWLRDFDWSIEQQAILAHELLHHLFITFEHIGIKYSREGEEAFTYYYQHIFEKVWNKLKPKKK